MMERRLGDRARRVEKTYNQQTGEEETEDNTYGIQDGQEEYFDQEFQRAMAGSRMPSYSAHRGSGGRLASIQQQQQQQRQIGYSDAPYARGQQQQRSGSRR